MKYKINRDQLRDVMAEHFPDYARGLDNNQLVDLFAQMFHGTIEIEKPGGLAIETSDDNFTEIAWDLGIDPEEI